MPSRIVCRADLPPHDKLVLIFVTGSQRSMTVHTKLPSPPVTAEEKKAVAGEVYVHVWQQAVSGEFAKAA